MWTIRMVDEVKYAVSVEQFALAALVPWDTSLHDGAYCLAWAGREGA